MSGKQYLLGDLWHWLNGWPEDRRKKPVPSFPQTTYFIDGPMEGQTRNVPPCIHWGWFEHHRVEEASVMTEVRYIWDTLYPNAEVAYMRLAPASITSRYTIGIDLAEPVA